MTKLPLLLLLVACAGVVTASHAAQNVIEEHVRRGKELIEANHYEAVGSTRAGLEAGIQELEKAIALGHESVEIYRILADAYSQMALVYSKEGSRERQIFFEKRNALYQKLYELEPDDPDILFLYTESLKNDDEKIGAYRRLLAIAPDRNLARSRLGRLLILKGEWQDGQNEIAKAVLGESDPTAVRVYVWGVLDVLRERGCPVTKSERWFRGIEQLEMRFDRVGGDATAARVAREDLEGFKKRFANVLRGHTCK